ncbi:MAG: DNA double-strand break repair nuclease NurA [Thermoplasmata archaeon]
MALETLNVKQVRDELRLALDSERPLLEELRRQVRGFGIHEIGYRRCYAISPVATDGGENRLSFDPVNLEIIRVVDSDGRERLQKILPLSGGESVFRNSFDPKSSDHVPVLVQFLERLGIEYDDLSYFLRPAEGGSDLRSAVRPFRDIAEWAVLLDIAWNPGRSKALVIRDGLLRTKALRKEIIAKLAKSFEDAYKDQGSLLVGVAKRSKVLNYLSLALALEGTFRKEYPCFCEIPREIERTAHPWWRTWLEDFTFGILHLVKFVDDPDGIALPVDIPDWLMRRRKEVLEYLAETAKSSFPTIGYPEPLIKAHEGAVLHGIEMSVLEDMLVEELLEEQPVGDTERTIEHVALGRDLKRGGWKKHG